MDTALLLLAALAYDCDEVSLAVTGVHGHVIEAGSMSSSRGG
jgi:hypothetical protein